MVTEQDVQTRILGRVGGTSDPVLVALLPLIWAGYADKALIWPRLQELYTLREALEVRMANVADQVDEMSDGADVKSGQRYQHLADLAKRVDAEIALVEKQATSFPKPEIGPITKVEPVPPPTSLPPFGPPDADDLRYSGSPYEPRPWPEGYR